MSVDTDLDRRDRLARRRTWVGGGVLLLLSALVQIAARGPLWVVYPAKDWLFAAAGILFAVGLGRAGSVTGRGLVGTVSTILVVVAPVTQSFWFGLVPEGLDAHAQEDAWGLIALLYFGIVAVLACTSVLSIGIVAVIPSPWHWAPARAGVPSVA